MRRTAEVDQAAVERVEHELAAAERSFGEREREHEALLSEAAADAALGSPGDAATKTRPSEQALDLAREHVEQLRRAVPAVRERWEQQQAAQAECEAQAAAKRLADACGKANASAAKLAKILAEADSAARSLIEARAVVDAAAKTAGARADDSPRLGGRRSRTALGVGTGRTSGWADEPSWADGIETLRDVLESGPRRPHAEGEVEAQRKEREREGQDRELLAWLRQRPSVSRAQQLLSRGALPEIVREEAEQILAAATSAAAARRTADAEQRQPEHEHEEVVL